MAGEVKEKSRTGMSVAALTLGIVSIIFGLFWYICIPTGISICAFLYISMVLLILIAM